jgi:hypothetical protein
LFDGAAMRLTFVALLLVGLSVLISSLTSTGSYLGEAPPEYEPVEIRELKPIERQSTTDVDESPRKEVLEAHEADLTPALEKRVITSDMPTQAVLPLVMSPLEETSAPEVVTVVEEAAVQKASPVLPLEEATLEMIPPVLLVEETNEPETGASPEASEHYTDQLIDFDSTGGWARFQDIDDEEQPEGLRSYSVEYRHYQDDMDRGGKSYEDGIILHARRETRDYGEFELLATVRDARPSDESSFDDSSGGRVTLRQYGFALNKDWLLDNSIGVLRSDVDPVLSSSYRFNLPSTLVSGVKNWSRAAATELRFSAGKIGTLGNGRIEDFNTTSGTLASMGASHALNSNWFMTGNVIALSDDDDIKDHESGALALQYQSADGRHRYVGHTLIDSDGGNAVWLDGDNQIGAWRQRYGIFWREADMLWGDAKLTDDQQGLYTRSEFRAPRYNLTVGTDFTENNVNDDNALPKNRFSNVFVSGNRRLMRTTSVGSTASYLNVDPRNSAARDDSRVVRLSAFVQQQFAIGDTRLELSGSDVEKNDESGNVYGISWDQSWSVSRWVTLSTTLSHEQSSGLDEDDERNSASMLFTHEVTPDLNWNGSASYARRKTDNMPDRDSYNVTFGGAWRFLPDWEANLDLTWTRAEENTGLLNEIFDVDEKTLLFSVRYDIRKGRPFNTAGNKNGGAGYGEVTGEVFFDDNRDGIRQAGERAASGVFVYLDRRYERVTDNEGRYTFNMVPAGEHAVSIAVEDLPLPWGLDDDRPQTVPVAVREDAVVNFALTRIIQ